jgi:Kef-type K+ transport system membrane component KefB
VRELNSPSSPRKAILVYALMILGAVGLFLAIDTYGKTLQAPEPPASTSPAAGQAGKGEIFAHVLLALAAVVAVGRALGKVFRYLGQPPVIGEVIGGILLGPSFLGQVAPDAYAYLLPEDVSPYLGVIAQLGIILYMFLVGLELNAAQLRQRAHAAIAISHAGIVVPFVVGTLLAAGLYPTLSSRDVSFTSFALFIGVALSITAFPVLARILTDRGLNKTELGVVALSCAAADDVTAWCLLALVVGVAQARMESAVLVIALALAYMAFMFWVVRPLLTRYASRFDEGRLNADVIALVFLGLLLSALATEYIGIHAIFGAFLLGAIIPHDCAIARQLPRKLEELVTILLLPAFFAFTGMRTEIGLVSGWHQWLLCGLIILVATVGKFGGTLLAARFTGMSITTAAGLAILMNTRGLMELIVLNIGLDLGIISPTLFAMMVLMALVTTLATTPVLHFLIPPTRKASGKEAASATEPVPTAD